MKMIIISVNVNCILVRNYETGVFFRQEKPTVKFLLLVYTEGKPDLNYFFRKIL